MTSLWMILWNANSPYWLDKQSSLLRDFNLYLNIKEFCHSKCIALNSISKYSFLSKSLARTLNFCLHLSKWILEHVLLSFMLKTFLHFVYQKCEYDFNLLENIVWRTPFIKHEVFFTILNSLWNLSMIWILFQISILLIKPYFHKVFFHIYIYKSIYSSFIWIWKCWKYEKKNFFWQWNSVFLLHLSIKNIFFIQIDWFIYFSNVVFI